MKSRKPFEELSTGGKWAREHPEYFRNWCRNNRAHIAELYRKWSTENPEKVKDKWKRYKMRHPEEYRLKHNLRAAEYSKGLRELDMFKLGGKCIIKDCESNKDPEEIRFMGLEIHELNGSPRDQKGRREFTQTFYRKIRDGKIKKDQVHLVCGYHHNIASRMGKSKWLEYVKINNAGIEFQEEARET